MQEVPFYYAPVGANSISSRCETMQQSTIRFCEDFVRPQLPTIRATREIPPLLLQRMKDTGWLGLLIDQKFGGMGIDCLHRIVNVEHWARECPDLGAILQIAQLGTGSILEFGSDNLLKNTNESIPIHMKRGAA